MAKFPIDLSRFKKISTNGKSTILAHPSGHKFIVSHSALSPEHREQLHALPFAGDSSAKHPNDSKRSTKVVEQAMASGGDPTQEHLLPGDKVPNAIEKQVVNSAKAKMAGGGKVSDSPPEPDPKKAAEMQKGGTESGWRPAEYWQNLKSGLGMAEGGQVKQKQVDAELDARIAANKKALDNSESAKSQEAQNSAMSGISAYADGGEVEDAPVQEIDLDKVDPKQPEPQEIDLNKQPEAVQEAQGATTSPDAAAQPEDAKAVPSPTVDPALARKRELYNFSVAQLSPSSGGDPRKVLGPHYTFGPNGEAPAQFNPASWAKAEQQFQSEQANKDTAANNAAQAAVLENKARAAAGLPAIPVPQAAAQVAEAGKEAPKADQGPMAMGQAPTAQPQGTNDPYGTQAYLDAYSQGLGEQKAGLVQEAGAQEQMGGEQAKMLQTAQARQQQNIDNYNTHFNNLNQERQNFVNDLNNQHINPNHYMQSLGTVGKIATAIGLIAGGIGAGLTHTQNDSLTYLNAQIDRDIDAQKAEIGKRENLLNANMHQFGNLRDATDMTRVMQTDVVSNQLKQAAAKAQGPLARARLLQAAGQLDQQSAPILSQMAMRKTLLGGMQNGQYAPEQVVRMIVPQAEQGAAFKELQSAQNMTASRDNLLSVFDQLNKVNTIGNRLTSPLQSTKQVNALREPALAKLVKDSEGRVTPQDTKMIADFFPAPGDNTQTSAVKRSQMVKFINEKMNYPMLKAYGINMGATGRYAPTGKPRIPESAPVIKKD